MELTLRIWRQKNNDTSGFLEDLIINNLEPLEDKLERLNFLIDELSSCLSKSSQKKQNKSQKKESQPLETNSPSGLIIQIGRNHSQNELISIKEARGGDLWFHAQECPGSHVVLKTSAGIADENDLSIAADLAAFFSRG